MRGLRLKKADSFARRRMNRCNPDVDYSYGVARKTGKRCCCWGCGNPRKYSGIKTFNEIRQDQEADYQEYLFLNENKW